MGYYYRGPFERLPIRDGGRSIYLVARPDGISAAAAPGHVIYPTPKKQTTATN